MTGLRRSHIKAQLSTIPAALLLLTLVACTGQTQRNTQITVLAEDPHFTLVRLQAGQTFADLAANFLGSASDAWQIAEANADHSASPGQVVAVPRQPVNPTSVYPDGYRTVPILCYHQFTQDRKSDNQLELTASAFEEQIRYLLANQFRILSFTELETILLRSQPIPSNAVIITIDDGYRSIYDVAWPILKQYQVKATLFVYTDFIGASSALTWQQMREMADSGLVDIQSHGKSHASLSRLPQDKTTADYRARVETEISGSNAVFKQRMGSVPVFMSYPYGNTSDIAAALVRDRGYRLAATVTRGDNTTYSDPFLLHRTMIYDSHDMADFSRFLQGFTRKNLQ
ncbi:MAG: polysaccharide deacetylase family protein [Halieaceae bacterium]|jgi:peptidoglycan/xylan/chitin deacetylase (PgdA/CDA1 family)|nr:polysaccharide deacetylase family protein [Halieaceae bacterium]